MFVTELRRRNAVSYELWMLMFTNGRELPELHNFVMKFKWFNYGICLQFFGMLFLEFESLHSLHLMFWKFEHHIKTFTAASRGSSKSNIKIFNVPSSWCIIAIRFSTYLWYWAWRKLNSSFILSIDSTIFSLNGAGWELFWPGPGTWQNNNG